GLHKYRGALQQRPMARLAEQLEDLPAFHAHTRPQACQRRHVELRPLAETPLPQHPHASHASDEARIRADDILAMLSIAHRRVRIVGHLTAAGRSYLIEPPIV